MDALGDVFCMYSGINDNGKDDFLKWIIFFFNFDVSRTEVAKKKNIFLLREIGGPKETNNNAIFLVFSGHASICFFVWLIFLEEFFV